ncbi:hypothetical protein KC326_g2385 [Hortaea werneckii]|nr:hypothetical protein KC326_g2385 [Hortaea werneckii]
MAIHPEVPGLTVCIEVDRRDLPEYDGEDGQDTSPGIVTKHIEAISGATFNISVRFNPGIFQYANQAVVVTVNCDGHPMSQTEFWAGFVDDGQVNKDLLGKLQDLGTITVKWYRAKVNLRKSYTANPSPESGPLVGGQLPEKNLKGQSVTHHTTYGAERVARRSGYRARSEYHFDRVGEPFAVFEFKYRSRGALQSLGLLPRSPSPIPLEDRSIEDLSLQEARELLRRQQGRLASNEASVKREGIKREIKRERIEYGDDNDNDGGGGIEIVDRPEKRRRLNANGAGTDVIDLCSDD